MDYLKFLKPFQPFLDKEINVLPADNAGMWCNKYIVLFPQGGFRW